MLVAYFAPAGAKRPASLLQEQASLGCAQPAPWPMPQLSTQARLAAVMNGITGQVAYVQRSMALVKAEGANKEIRPRPSSRTRADAPLTTRTRRSVFIEAWAPQEPETA